ncbi:hypothetical protein SAMN04487944_11699 [Gracilibacillus ureilyticus]|uniref:Uncharacterized protein n=1 Tax=Gracilibacillus ureilyticus TaxID=531814 RepID=A0A1H9U9Y5_9BACI|nr:hypothetical protein SAMN04487944_11699 [Gracilibacillus ureilyticus]
MNRVHAAAGKNTRNAAERARVALIIYSLSESQDMLLLIPPAEHLAKQP